MNERLNAPLIATQTPKTKKTPDALAGEGVSKVFKSHQSGDRYLSKRGIIKIQSRHIPKKFRGGGVV
ncbi:hypothetical protein IQ219_00255 [Synechocystis sp. LEGE 06083]|jgi:hypothetical protein|uniref:hypothetical protein n=1 Tax=Synechocystis sp. LEGE 06083 TaxID=915336 RepID=UPI00187F93F4|nr:hypothetical protein [Synechocystis sp. LEGE 06083]MBE9193792.1 hypothetical protein [Synechocystis sp. LEGE 06083]